MGVPGTADATATRPARSPGESAFPGVDMVACISRTGGTVNRGRSSCPMVSHAGAMIGFLRQGSSPGRAETGGAGRAGPAGEWLARDETDSAGKAAKEGQGSRLGAQAGAGGRSLEYPSWSRAVGQPISPFAQQGVCKDDDAPHDGRNGDLLCFAGL